MAKVVVTAKPGRSTWAQEEALDTLIPLDPDARLVETGYPGVFIIETVLGPRDVARAYSKYEHAFISTIVPVIVEVEASERVYDAVAGLASTLKAHGRGVCLLARLRGESKNLVGERRLREVIQDAGLAVVRKSNLCIVIEGVGRSVFLSAGMRASCGPSCLLVAVVG